MAKQLTKRPLPQRPLHQRRTRILLLLRSYWDAFYEPGVDNENRAKPGSITLRHNPDLWPHGSYTELDQALEKLRAEVERGGKWRQAHPAVMAVYINGSNRHLRRRLPHAVRGVDYLEQTMPQTIHVPQDISENAGYKPHEAKLFAKTRKRAA